ncbi:MAG: CPBP family glutamic-type intramembrane protease [Phycisphaerae bacterium]
MNRLTFAGFLARYFQVTCRPLYQLVILLPLIATYELGRLVIQNPIHSGREIVARRLINLALQWFGMDATWLAGVVFLGILVYMHSRARRVPEWRTSFALLMILESAVLALPLLMLSKTMLFAGAASAPMCLQAIGSAVYEEFLFRFLLLGALLWLLRAKLGVRKFATDTALVVAVGILFSLFHFRPVSSEVFAVGPFVYRALAGAYLGGIFISRGIGIAVGAHAVHNLAVLLSGGWILV